MSNPAMQFVGVAAVAVGAALGLIAVFAAVLIGPLALAVAIPSLLLITLGIAALFFDHVDTPQPRPEVEG